MSDNQSHLREAAARAERLFEATGAKTAPEATPTPVLAVAERVEAAKRGLGYWLWRLRGRPAAPLLVSGKGATARLVRAVDNYSEDLDRARERIAHLEARLAERDTAADRLAQAETRAARAEGLAAEAEAALAQARSRIEIQKDVIEVAKAAAKGGAAVPDLKFREVKRAFARMYHPDTAPDAERQRLFAEFWPVLERIDRGD